MVGVLTFVFTKVFPNARQELFPCFCLWAHSTKLLQPRMANRTTSLVDNAMLIQTHALSTGDRADHDRVGQLFALFIQLALLLALVLGFRKALISIGSTWCR